jgi:hypothetical protein
LKPTNSIFFVLFFVLTGITNYAQQQTKMTVALDSETKMLRVNQSIVFTNNSNKSIDKIVLNDWNHAYSDKSSPLGLRFSDEYVRNFHFALNSERGVTNIKTLKVNNNPANWKRLLHHVDLIEINLGKKLAPQESINIETEYDLKIPDSKFTRFGYENGDYNLKNCFLSVARLLQEGDFIYNSNENLEDIANSYYEKISIDYILPKEYKITTDFELKNEKSEGNNKLYSFYSENITEIQLAIEKKSSYQLFKNDTIDIETNIKSSTINDIEKAIVINRVINFVAKNLVETKQKKMMVSQIDYERNPFYGLNQLPSILSPFPNEFIYEIKFLKTYLYNYLKTNLKIDQRKDGYLLDAIQMYMMMQYIEENYPKNKLLGNLSTFKILKGYHLTDVNFNEQYNYFYLLMARENLDQTIGDSKNTFVKFNEQIAGKYKAGLSFKYLKDYLQDNSIENSFKEFLELNKSKQTASVDFENILKKNSSKNIDWFFPNLIYSRKLIDYKFSKIRKSAEEVQVTIKNNSNITVPISFYGLKRKEIVFKKWFSDIKVDTTFVISRKNIDKIGLNYQNEVPEFNARNNWKSLRSIFSLDRPIKFNFYKDLENPKYTQIFYVPEVSFNLYDGALLAMSLNNKSFLEKPFSFDVSPSYSVKTGNIYGSGGFGFSKYFRDSNLYNARLGLSGSYYQYAPNATYTKINPTAQIKFREDNFRNNKRKYIYIRQVFVEKEDSPVNKTLSPEIANAPLKYSVFDARYVYGNTELLRGLSYVLDFQLANSFGKISTDVSYRKLYENNFELRLRLYAGSFIYKNTTTDFFDFGLDRPKDYLFDYNFYGRSESKGFFSQQIIIAEGGFKSKFKNPYVNQWITAFNVDASLWQWIQLYGDVGLAKNKGDNTRFLFDSGIHLNFVPGYFEVYLPVYSTNGFELTQKSYQEKIRFVVTFSPRTLTSLFTRKWF